MKRIDIRLLRSPVAATWLLLGLCAASVVYWGVQIVAPRPTHTLAPHKEVASVDPTQAAPLFGGESNALISDGNYRLLGVMVARTNENSIAIISLDDKPGRPIRVGAELEPGVTLAEVQTAYVMLSSHGVMQRLMLPGHVPNKTSAEAGNAATSTPPPGVPPAPPEDKDPHPPNPD